MKVVEIIQEINDEISSPKNRTDNFKTSFVGIAFESMEEAWSYNRQELILDSNLNLN